MMVLAAPFVRHQIVDEIYKECQKDDSDGYIPKYIRCVIGLGSLKSCLFSFAYTKVQSGAAKGLMSIDVFFDSCNR